jgi:hypothetical protein
MAPKRQPRLGVREAAIPQGIGFEDGFPFTYLIDGRHKSLHCRIPFGGSEQIVESRRSNDTRHDALVISKENETSRRYRRDS